MSGQAFLFARQLDVAGRVVQNHVLFCQPFEKHADGDQPIGLYAKAERLLVFVPEMKEMSLVSLYNGLGDLLWLGKGALQAPADEVFNVVSVVLDGGVGIVTRFERCQILVHPIREAIGNGILRECRASFSAFFRHVYFLLFSCVKCSTRVGARLARRASAG